ncbi:hypothetical protein AB1Y20_022958 [Prymnesium parvum]|uniref:Uncharacterized protein n=1 Tax=Prymnesium parvum TaxID=97485 RepID=A0AB34JFB1_PRYPA|mmetsp:Transcript_3163/g.7852  ORF Transcript_3163/g.7852 Transcript_3163/m.7852 type:complete len:107 (-) Transcript_3163:121-441(-)|eukprot:CAMPEP_0184389318 /NCGR_PEP_ID=MMETSP0007-20130409/12375_1 /TAXON_ID=97485 /ORGANISM="Prymnesium parvum, Strain Texoma1" /LENGTH=106 /DNA_ID=CAMNT_0026738583 /DNA_START=107 /DNA_END=427 /DNA_ORIENTATION=+
MQLDLLNDEDYPAASLAYDSWEAACQYSSKYVAQWQNVGTHELELLDCPVDMESEEYARMPSTSHVKKFSSQDSHTKVGPMAIKRPAHPPTCPLAETSNKVMRLRS